MGRTELRRIFIIFFICCAGCAWPAFGQTAPPVLIKDVTVVDTASGKLEEHVDLQVVSGAIADIGHDLKPLAGETVIDKSGKFVVPGLIDTRVQIALSPGNRITRAEFGAEQRVAWLNSMVASGVTTARLIQGDLSEHVAFRHFRELSLLNGPWVVASGPTFTAVDGIPANQYSIVAIQTREKETHEVSDEDAAVKQSRDVAHNGGEVFEINFSKGPAWIDAPRLKDNLLAILTKEAHGHDLHAFCWVGTNEEAKAAIANGCDALEGLSEELVSDEVVSLMKEKKVPFVPSLVDQGYLAVEKTNREAYQAYISQPVVQQTLSPLMKDSFKWTPDNQVAQLNAALDRLIPKPEKAPKFKLERDNNGVLQIKPEPSEPTPEAAKSPAAPTEPGGASKPNSDNPAQQPPAANVKFPTVREALHSQEERARENTKRLNAAGVPIVTGTGAGSLLNIPGASEHLELQLLVGAGLTPLQALQAATRNAAAAMGGGFLGTIEKDKRADFLLLNSNPLSDIKNTADIDTVVRGGWVVDSRDPKTY